LEYALSWEVEDTVLDNYIVLRSDTAQIFGEYLKRVYLEKSEGNWYYDKEYCQKFGLRSYSSYYMSGDGGGAILYGAIINGIEYGDVTSIEQKQTYINRPSSFKLFQNYPNPFNSYTEMKFEIFRGSNISFSIYNLTGKEIKILIDGYTPPGLYTYIWDGTDETGFQVPSGKYFYRLLSKDFKDTQKMIKIE
jgi:hypothetical protein